MLTWQKIVSEKNDDMAKYKTVTEVLTEQIGGEFPKNNRHYQ